MATSKRKAAPAAKKKPAAGKSKPAKKSAAAGARKPHKAAKPARKPVPAKKSGKKAAAAKPARKAAPPKVATPKVATPKVAPRKAAVPAPAKPVKAAAAPVPGKTATAPKKATMASKATASTSPTELSRDDGRYALPSTVVISLPAGYHPSPKEEYMSPRHLAYFRAKLQKWREDLVEESKQTIDNLRDEVRDVGDEAERATRETENSLELRTRDRYRKLIAKIDKALKRIEEGRYGFCEETDEEIGLERLEARPIATLCLDAQERWEHRQKQMGD